MRRSTSSVPNYGNDVCFVYLYVEIKGGKYYLSSICRMREIYKYVKDGKNILLFIWMYFVILRRLYASTRNTAVNQFIN